VSWIKIDDNFADHPKVIKAGPLAGWLYICGLTYCGRYLTDGWIPRRQVRKLADVDNAEELVGRLVAVGLWEEVEDGYRVHDYLAYNPSAEHVRGEREANAQRQAEFRERRSRSRRKKGAEHGADAGYPVEERRNEQRNGVTHAVTNAPVTPAPSPSPSPVPIDDDVDDDDNDRPSPPPPGSELTAWERWQATLGGRGALDRQDCATRVGAYGEPAVIEAIERMREQPRDRWCLKYVDVTLDNLAEESRPPPVPPPIDEPQAERVEPVADVPWWGDFAARVRGAVPQQVFELYLARALPVAYSDSVLVLGIGHVYGKEWCENRLYKAIQRAASEAAGRSVSVRFIVLGNRRAPPGVAMGEAATVAVEAT